MERMRISGKKKKPRGINVEVSPKAHAAMTKESLKAKPKKTLRAIVNIKNNLSEDE